jgi:hypothetical protein
MPGWQLNHGDPRFREAAGIDQQSIYHMVTLDPKAVGKIFEYNQPDVLIAGAAMTI